MTDTPSTGLDAVKTFIGDLARPFVLIWTGLCAGISMLMLAAKIDDPVQAGVFIGVVYTTGVSAIYIGTALEERGKAQSSAEVEIARAKSEAG